MGKDKNKELDNSKILQLQKSEMFSGPVPHPDVIDKYEKIYPGAAKIIFDEWDSQVKHRHKIEKSVIRTDNAKSILGVIFGFIIAIIAVLGGIYTVLNGHSLFGGGISTVGLAMIIGAFITNKQKKDK